MQIVRLPRLGQTMESGIITLWHVAEGAPFTVGDPLYEVETEKMSTEVEAKQDGVLARVVVAAGNQEVPVGTLLAVTTAPGETIDPAAIDELIGTGAPVEEEADDPAMEESTGPASPFAAPDDEPEPARQGASDAPVEQDEPAPARQVLAVPKARAVAKTRDIDLATVQGSGEDGVVRVVDVLKASKARKKAAAPRLAVPDRSDEDGYVGPPRVAVRIPVRGVGKAMAHSMVRSWSQVPQFVQQISLDATQLASRLKRLRYEGIPVTYTDLLVAAVGMTASEVPEVNATFAGEEIVRYSDVNVSIAVATDRGLLVPVVRRADALSVREIAATTKALAERAREGRLTSQDMEDGTITVSNLGAFGIDTGTPIVNAPQSAIVFVGSMADQAVVVNGAITVQPRLNVAVAYDHRVVDGMAAATFTSALKKRLEAGG